MRGPLIAGLCLWLAACSNGEVNPIASAVVDELLPGGAEAPADGARAPLTREALTRADVASVRARLVADERPTFLFAASDNGGYVTYSSSLRQSLTLRGSWITGSRGLGWDLLSATSSRPDPLVTAIPPGQWPEAVTRSYEFSAFAPQGRVETYRCTFAFGALTEIVIFQQRYRGYEVTETCVGDAGQFENLHFADAASGFVWRSLQRLGPQQGLIDLEILIPYTGRRG